MFIIELTYKDIGVTYMKKLNFKGQALVEYVLIIALISIVLIGVVNTFGGILKDKITEASCSISGQTYVNNGKAGDGYCE